jgi:hypothetical protein
MAGLRGSLWVRPSSVSDAAQRGRFRWCGWELELGDAEALERERRELGCEAEVGVVAAHADDACADAQDSPDSRQRNRMVKVEILDVRCEEVRRN